MRPPPRAVGDDHVDRPEVRRPRGQSRPVLMARAASRAAAGRNRPRGRRARPPFPCVARHQCVRAHRPPFRAATAAGLHLFPSRTEQLSPPAPMVLRPARGRVGRRPPCAPPGSLAGARRGFFLPLPPERPRQERGGVVAHRAGIPATAIAASGCRP